MHNFKPGDRVYYNEVRHMTHSGERFNTVPDGTLGTIEVSKDAEILVLFDNGEKRGIYPENIKRQPIEPGCWVRHLEVPSSSALQVLNVYDTLVDIANIPVCWRIDRLARVKAPEAIKTVDISAFDQINSLTAISKALTSIVGDDAIKVVTDLRKQLSIAENARLDAIAERDDAHVAIREATKLLRYGRIGGAFFRDHDGSREWLAKHASEPTLNRGEVVTWGVGCVRARIIDMTDPEAVEVMNVQQQDNYLGPFLFTKHKLADLRRPE